jgi:hypothetical protein
MPNGGPRPHQRIEMDDKHHLVRIHIDREPRESPDPTTGEALYALAAIPKPRELFKVVGGDHEDELVPREAAEVHLKADEHLYSQKAIDIIVNGERKEVTETKLTYDQVAKLAFPVPPPGANIMFLITYRHGPKQNPKGSLLENESVYLKNKMIFDVTPTDRS